MGYKFLVWFVKIWREIYALKYSQISTPAQVKCDNSINFAVSEQKQFKKGHIDADQLPS